MTNPTFDFHELRLEVHRLSMRHRRGRATPADLERLSSARATLAAIVRQRSAIREQVLAARAPTGPRAAILEADMKLLESTLQAQRARDPESLLTRYKTASRLVKQARKIYDQAVQLERLIKQAMGRAGAQS